MTVSPEAEWRTALGEGRLLLQRARGSGDPFFPPRLMEPRTGNGDLEWIEASGLGTVYSVTVVSQKPPTPNYNVALVELDEGPRVMSRIEQLSPEDVTIGLRVRARISKHEDGEPILLFDPA